MEPRARYDGGVRYLYNLLLALAAPAAFASHLWRGFGNRAHWQRLGERFGYTRLFLERHPIWIHAVSVGEVQAVQPVVQRLLAQYAGVPLLITTGTVTGAARVHTLFGSRVHHCYLPYDLPGAVARFLERTQPRLGIVMETELWPNLFRACVRRHIPMIIASARISPRTAARYRWLAGLFRDSLPQFQVMAQTPADAERFRTLGAAAERVAVGGNLKFDIEIAPEIFDKGMTWRDEHASRRPVWTAGSTHDAEEAQVLAAHREVLSRYPDALLVLAPRHPQRFEHVHALLAKRGFVYAARSRQQPVTQATQVLLLDTLGELMQFYAASDVVFVGGSLVPVGGHNLLEPAALAVPILSGPSVFNAADIAAQFFAAGAARQIHSPRQLAAAVRELLRSDEQRRNMGSKALELVARNRGALNRVLQTIERAWQAQAGESRAS